MTTNQFNYAQLSEQRRSNVARELENRRHNVETEGLTLREINETVRHNMSQESLDAYRNWETNRHNVATEGLGYANLELGYRNLDETNRHNVVVEGIQSRQAAVSERQLAESARHNLAVEAQQRETNRIGAYKASTDKHHYERQDLIARTNAETNAINADTQRRKVSYDYELGREGQNLDESKYKSSVIQKDREFNRDNRRWFVNYMQQYLPNLDAKDAMGILGKAFK